VIGIAIHRTFGEVVMWEDRRLRRLGRVDMTGTVLEGLGGSYSGLTRLSLSSALVAE
jgi:transposase